jgi:hypothetical protein
MGSIMGSQNIMGSIMGSQNIIGSDYRSNISAMILIILIVLQTTPARPPDANSEIITVRVVFTPE